MVRPIIATLILIATFGVNSTSAQQPASFKHFSAFRNLAPGVDFFASNRQTVAPYEKPVTETMGKLKDLLGSDLPRGAIFICSTLEQKDSIYEPKVLKSGYGWSLTAVTAAVRSQEMLARIKAQMGGDVPAELLSGMKNMPTDMMSNVEKQMVTSVTQQIAHAVIQTLLDKELQYRSTRLDDMGKSPLPDWLDIGIASYVSGTNSALSFLQQNMDQTFPIEDVLSMSRPFVASSSGQNGGFGGGRGSMGGGMGSMGGDGGNNGGFSRGQGGGFPGGFGGGMGGSNMGGFGGRAGGGFPNGGMGGSGGPGGSRGGMQRTMPKDEQDRTLFDGQSSTFFAYMLEKIGIDKVRELINQVREGKESRDLIIKPDVLGPDFEKIEADWVAWVKTQKAEDPFRRN